MLFFRDGSRSVVKLDPCKIDLLNPQVTIELEACQSYRSNKVVSFNPTSIKRYGSKVYILSKAYSTIQILDTEKSKNKWSFKRLQDPFF